MAGTTTNISIRMDADLKAQADALFAELGMNLSTAITIFCRKLEQERRIPFEITADPDPFYSESNVRELKRRYDAIKAGTAKLEEHELIEAE